MPFNIDEIQRYIAEYSVSVLTALAIFFVGRILVKVLKKAISNGLTKSKVDKTVAVFISNIAYGLALAFVIIAALSQLGIQTSSLVAIIAAAGLAVGLALQSSLSSFASGVMIILFRLFKIGDFVEVAGTSGTVEEINIFNTLLKTADNKSVVVPNASITSGNIVNYSAKGTRRIDLIYGCSYADDLKKVKKVLNDIVASDPRILPEPEPVVALLELADSSVNFAVRPWVNSADYWPVRFDLNEKVKTEFDKAGISIPFPQQEVRFYNASEEDNTPPVVSNS